MFWEVVSIAAVVALGVLAVVILWQIAKATEVKGAPKKNASDTVVAEEDFVPDDDVNFQDMFVTVAGKASRVVQHGKYRSEIVYNVAFRTDDGQILEFAVEKDVFARINEGQEGTLILANGNFFDFGDGREIESE